MGAPEGSDVGTPVGGLVGSADGLVGTDVGTPVGFVVGTPVGDSVVGTDDGAGVGSGTMTCSLRAPSSASFTNCRRRPSGALLDGLWAAAGAARQASATSAAIDRIFVGFAVSGLALDPRGGRRGLPGAGVGAKIAARRSLWLATIFGARQRRPKLPLAFCPHCIKRTVPSLAASHGPSRDPTPRGFSGKAAPRDKTKEKAAIRLPLRLIAV